MTDQKKFHLTSEETKNLIGRETMIDYLKDLVQRDINMYLYMNIIPRLNLDPKDKYTLSEDRTWIEITPEIIVGKKEVKTNGEAKPV